MATTYKRMCIEDHTISDRSGNSQSVKKGKEYLTSPENEDGNIIVFSTFWVQFPSRLFTGAIQFTGPGVNDALSPKGE